VTIKPRDPNLKPLYLRPAKAAVLLDFGRAKIYDLIDRGELHAVTIGGQLRIPVSEIERLKDQPEGDD
jgi:excisionase family DNA binding protein